MDPFLLHVLRVTLAVDDEQSRIPPASSGRRILEDAASPTTSQPDESDDHA